MRVIANLTFDEFVGEFQKEFTPSWECPLKKVIGNEARRFANNLDTNPDPKLIPAKEWRDERWKKWLIDSGFAKKSKCVLSINDQTTYSLRKGSGGVDEAKAIYYALHRHVCDRSYAKAIDDVMFDGPFLKNNKPVFEIAPDPVAPTAPFSHPQYHLYDSIKDKLRKSPENGMWLDPHNHHSIPLSSRDGEKSTLTQFMDAPEPFLILPLIAPSGAGKTRLISQWMRQYVPSASDTEWDAGFVDSTKQNSRDPQPWCDWEITRPTLIVIDYTFAYDAVVREIAERARRNPTKHKIRLVVIDHIYPKFLKDDHIWGKMFGSPGQLNLFERTIIRPSLELKSEIAGSKLLRDVIAAAASLGDKTFTADDPLIIEAEGHLTRMGEASGDETHGDPNAVRHPLFAALMGQAIRGAEGENVDFSKWTRRDLITYYFAGENRLPWKVWDDGRGVSVGALVCAATLRRGLPIGTQIRRNLAKNAGEIIDYAKRVVSSDNGFIIKPFLPDILGEAFLLLFLEFIENDEIACADFIRLLSDDEIDQGVAVDFQESIARLVRNLSNDNQSDPAVQRGWNVLSHFLNPALFKPDTALRIAILRAIADAMEHVALIQTEIEKQPAPYEKLNLATHIGSLLRAFEEQFSLPELERAIFDDNENTVDLIGLMFSFLETRKCCEPEWEIDGLKRIAQVFKTQYESDSTLLMFTATQGYDAAFELLLKYSDENIDAMDGNGETVAMYACQHGRLAIIDQLLQPFWHIDVNQSDLDGWTLLMFASFSGNTDVVDRLLQNDQKVQVDAETLDGWTVLMLACQAGELAVVNRLLQPDAKADVNAKAQFGATSLITACANNRRAVVERLLQPDALADIGDCNFYGETALMIASKYGHVEILQILLNYDDGRHYISYPNDDEETALMLASKEGQTAIVKLLLSANIWLNSRQINRDGKTASSLALENKNLEIVALLDQAVCDRGPDF